MGTPLRNNLSGVGDILDAGFRLWRDNLATFAKITLVLTVPVQLVWFGIQLALLEGVSDLGVISDQIDTYDVAILLLAVVGILAQLITFGALFHAAGSALVNDAPAPSVGASMAAAFKRFFPWLVLSVIAVIATSIGLIAVLVGAIFVAGLFSLTAPAFWIERVGPLWAIRRGVELNNGRYWKNLGVTVLAFIIVGGLSTFTTLISVGALATSSVVIWALLNAIPTVLSAVITYPVIPSLLSASYIGSRIANEGFDIDLMVRNLPPDESLPTF